MNFEISFCEYNRQNPPKDRIYRPGGSGDYLFLLLKTPMKFCIGGELALSRENACILYTPQTMQDYEAVQKFRNSYIHFLSSEDLAGHFGIPVNTLFYPGNSDEIDDYIRKIQEERIASGLFAEEKECYLLNEMFISIARAMAREHTVTVENRELYEIFLSLRLEMLRSYEKPWTTDDLCSRVNLEKSQFFACYQRFFQSTPHADLLSVRLEKAKTCLPTKRCPSVLWRASAGFLTSPIFPGISKRSAGVLPESMPVSGRNTPQRPQTRSIFLTSERAAPAALLYLLILSCKFGNNMARNANTLKESIDTVRFL